MDELQIHATRSDGATVLTLEGEIDMASAPQLREALDDAQGSGLPIVLDMAAVTFMDSAGINVLIDASKAYEDSSCNVCITSPSEAVQQLLKITGLADLFAPPN